jgi:hypothetical protein
MLPPPDPPYPPPPPPPPPPAPPVEEGLPWERASAGLGSIFATIGRFVTSPIQAFSQMSLAVDLVRPISYYVVLVLIGAAVAQIWNAIFFAQTVEMLRRFLPPEMAQQLAPFLQRPGAVQIVLGLVVVPLIMLIVLFIWTALVHAGLVILGGAGAGFPATLRVVCYARTGDLGLAVPFVGNLVAFVWRRILEAIGLTTAHKCDPWKAVLAIIFPLILCCACIAVGAFAFGAAIAAALKQVG